MRFKRKLKKLVFLPTFLKITLVRAAVYYWNFLPFPLVATPPPSADTTEQTTRNQPNAERKPNADGVGLLALGFPIFSALSLSKMRAEKSVYVICTVFLYALQLVGFYMLWCVGVYSFLYSLISVCWCVGVVIFRGAFFGGCCFVWVV